MSATLANAAAGVLGAAGAASGGSLQQAYENSTLGVIVGDVLTGALATGAAAKLAKSPSQLNVAQSGGLTLYRDAPLEPAGQNTHRVARETRPGDSLSMSLPPEPSAGAREQVASTASKGGLGQLVDGGYEAYYRSMSRADYGTFLKTGRLPATGETFISPTRAFAESYDGILVRFQVAEGTTARLRGIGVRSPGSDVAKAHPELPEVGRGWSKTNALFKQEPGQINIGLGRGDALDIFNDAIRGFETLRVK